MAKALNIEPRTESFVKEYERLKSSGQKIDHESLAKILGLKSKSSISEILGRRQNITMNAWEAFKTHFNVNGSEGGSEDSEKDVLLHGQHSVTIQEHIKLLKENDRFFKDTFTQFASNLTALVTMVSAGHRTELAYHEVMLQALARLEKKPENALVEVAYNNDAEAQKRELSKGMRTEKNS